MGAPLGCKIEIEIVKDFILGIRFSKESLHKFTFDFALNFG